MSKLTTALEAEKEEVRSELMKRLFRYGEAQHIPGICMADITEIVLEILEKPNARILSVVREIVKEKETAITMLQNYSQRDEDGVTVIVSRQAIDEVVDLFSDLSQFIQAAIDNK